MTKKKIQVIVDKSLNHFVRKINGSKSEVKRWKYTWFSIATIKKKNIQEPKRIPRVEKYLAHILQKLNKKRSIKINYTYSCGANYRCVIKGKNHTDVINVPCIKRYQNKNYYYKTIFHELFHCLMDRTKIGDHIDNYEDEEITAELCAMLLSVFLGMNAWRDSFKYIGNYILNNGGYIIHKGRLSYIQESSRKLLEYLLKLK